MKNVTIKITKKSNNKFAWSNRNVGQTVTATKNSLDPNDDTSKVVYHVNFSENKGLEGVSPDMITGFIDLENAEEI